MTDEPSAIDISELGAVLDGAREFMRVWAKDNGPVTCIIDAHVVGPDPFLFGLALVDCVRNGANAYGQALGISTEEALARIWEGVDAEREQPTDSPKQIIPNKELN